VTSLDIARKYIAAGYSVVAIPPDGSKRPGYFDSSSGEYRAGKWDDRKATPPTENELLRMFPPGHAWGIGLVQGKVSGNAELLDFDAPDIFDTYLGLCNNHDLGELVRRLVRVRTPSGGVHLYYRLESAPEGNTKLAMRPGPPEDAQGRTPEDMKRGGFRLDAAGQWAKVETLIETRGEGGQSVAPGSPLECHPDKKPYVLESGRFTEVPILTMAERNALFAMARACNEWVEPTAIHGPPKSKGRTSVSEGKRPGDDYNERATDADVLTLLLSHGWQEAGRRGDIIDLTRPGKSKGLSGTLNHDGPAVFHCFTSSASPFDIEKSYPPFSVFAMLECGGDFSEAARRLAEQGYGEKSQAQPRAARRPISGTSQSDDGESEERKPVIVVTNRPDRDISADAWDAIHTLNDPPTLYTRGEALASIGCDAEEDKSRPDAPKIIKAKVRQVDEKSLLFRLRRVADFVSHRRVSDKATGETRIIETHVPAPSRIAEDMIRDDVQRLRLPILRAVVNAPVVNQRGELLTAPGYHQGGLYLATEGLPSAPVHPPTVKEAQDAYLRLFGKNGVFADFPFASDCDRANAAALLLTPFLRPYIAGNAPLALIEAPEKGTGKTLLARNLLRVFDPVPPMVSIEETVKTADMSAELNKVLTMALKSGPASLLIDNVRGLLSCSILEAMLTTIDPVLARILGSSASAAIYPDLVTFAVTSNNAEMNRDMARRSYIIRLDANMERPEDRTGFRIPDIDGYIAANRPAIIGAVLTILSAWIGAGRPEGVAVKGGFQRWASVVSGVFDLLDVPGFLTTDKDAAATLDPEGARWGTFLEAWFERYGTMQRTAKDLLDIAEEAEIITDQHAPRAASQFGKMLARNRERVFAGKKILANTGQGGTLRYFLKAVQTVESHTEGGSSGSSGSNATATRDPSFANEGAINMGHGIEGKLTHLTHLTHPEQQGNVQGNHTESDGDGCDTTPSIAIQRAPVYPKIHLPSEGELSENEEII